MDTTVGVWLEGHRRVYVVVILDDCSRAAVAVRVFPTDSSYHTLLTLRKAMERYGRPRVLYTDNDSKFRLTRYQRSRFFTYHQETLHGLVETEAGRALRELDIQLLSYLPGNAQAKGKIERFLRFLQERVLDHNRASSLEDLQALVEHWVEEYNARHVNRDTGCTPAERLRPSGARPLEDNPEDIFCLKEERKVAKDHTITLDGVSYTLLSEPCLVAFKVQLHIHPGERLGVWHAGCLVAELPHKDKGRLRDAPLAVEQVLEDILPATRQSSSVCLIENVSERIVLVQEFSAGNQGRGREPSGCGRVRCRTAAPYGTAEKGLRKRTLDEFCQTTGMHCKGPIHPLHRGRGHRLDRAPACLGHGQAARRQLHTSYAPKAGCCPESPSEPALRPASPPRGPAPALGGDLPLWHSLPPSHRS